MKGHFVMLVLLAMVSAAMAAPIPLDVVFPREAEPIVGRVKDVETLFLVVVVEGSSEPARVALGDIERVDFGEAQRMADFLRRAPATPVPELQKFWEQRLSLLEVPGSTGGVIGLRYVRRLLGLGTMTAAGKALEVADVIIEKDWNPETKQEAGVLRAAALLALGRGLEAASALHQMADADLGPLQRGMVALMQGDVERRLGNRKVALEEYLKAYVFGGPSPDLARAGLERAGDLVRELPDSAARLRSIEQQLAGFKAREKDKP